MGYYNNIFASSFKYYSNPRFKGTPAFGASLIVILCQNTLFWLVLLIFKKFYGFDYFSLFPNRYLFLIPYFIWGIFVVLYYNKARVEKVVILFNQKKIFEKRVWYIITVLSATVPLIIFACLLQ